MYEGCFWASLQIGIGLSNRTMLHLYRRFRSGRAVLNAGPEEFQSLPLSSHVIERILRERGSLVPEKTAAELESKKIKVTVLGEPDYPKLLAEIPDPPVLLYSKGCLPPSEMPLIALVGSRKATPYGRIMAKKLAGELAAMGWGVVSGMARGIDSAAHEGALSAKGYTLAVLGCGIDVCYPRENQMLYERIAEEGCLLSEFPPGTSPCSKNFPIRNRLISGCSLGTVVVEAGEKSGSLITAGFALEQGRDVFAVPGNATNPQSRGSNNLIKQGAKLVESAEDIISEYPYLRAHTPERDSRESSSAIGVELPPQEAEVFKHLSSDAIHIDQLAKHAKMPVSLVGSILTLLELKGLAKRLDGDYYISADFPKR